VSRRAVALLAAVAAVATAYVFPGPSAQASASPTPVESWVTNGDVHAVLTSGGRTYIAGAFDQVGPNTGFGVPLDSGTGLLPANFAAAGAKVDGHIYAAVPDGKGGWYVGGDFTHVTVGGVQKSFHNGAEIKPDGNGGWTFGSWNPNTDLPILAIVRDPSGARIYVGGDFTSVRGLPGVNGLLVTGPTGVQLTSPAFPVTGPGQEVDSLALSVDGSRLYVGGTFTTLGGLGRSGLAAVNTATGTVDPTWNPSPDTAAGTATTPAKTVAALATASDGRVFAGGSFTQIGGTPTGGLAVLSGSGSGAPDPTWSVAAGGEVDALAMTLDRSAVYVGGGFATIGGQSRAGLALLSTAGAGSVDATFNPGATGGNVLALGLSADGNRLYAGGAFSAIGGTAQRYLAALDAHSGAVDPGFDAAAANTVQAVSPSPDGTLVFAGGDFTSVNGVARHNVAALDGNGVLVPGFVADTSGGASGGEVDALTVDGAGRLYLGGSFLRVNGTFEQRLARVDATTGTVDTSFSASPGAAVNTLAVSGTRLFVGGAFTWINDASVVRNNLASLDITAGAVEGWNPNLDNNVASLALSPDQHTVYIAGTFAHVGSASRSFAAAVDAGTGLATAWDPAPAALVVQVAVSGDGSKVFLAERGSSKTGNRLQAWNTAGSGSLAWEHRADGDFQAVAVSSAYVYAGGHFATVDGEAHLHLVALDVNSGAIQSWPPFVSGGLGHGVFAIDVTPSTVTVGGDFERAGDADPANALTIVAQGVARFPNSPDPFPTTTTTTTTTQPGPTTTTTTTTAPGGSDPGAGAAADKAGYWMIGSDGAVYSFGDAGQFGGAVPAAGTSAVDLEPTPSGRGYWIVTDAGVVTTRGDASFFGQPAAGSLPRGETVTSLSATPTGRGYWIFTSRGRVMNFGDAAFYGDMSKTKLNAPVLDSIPTTSGHGYYMVAGDGGIFSFGDAQFYGSMGDKKLNAPVESLVPTGDGAGYWLVASDGGIFAFGNAPFQGSMGGTKLNRPVTGMVRYADGYLMVGEDGGIFDFSAKPFLGSLGANPPAHPIVSVAALG